MTEVTETLEGRANSYLVRRDDGTEELVRTTCSRHEVNSLETLVLWDSKMGVLLEPSRFLTYELASESRNTATQAANAMKSLANYSEIVRVPFEAFGIQEARGYVSFLLGALGEGPSYTFRLLTTRSSESVNSYLKAIRRYARFVGATNSPFLQSKRAVSRSVELSGSEIYAHRIRAKVVVPTEAPRYVSFDECRRVLAVIERDWGLGERCIVRLMFEHGLRIGEVLGLTTEDVKARTDSRGRREHMVVLRNRTSDRHDQCAKTLMRVASKRQYQSTDYKTNGFGLSRVYISESLFLELLEYAETAHTTDPHADDRCAADSVEGNEANHYVFINTAGRPLSQNLWNKRLRRIMAAAGVHTDKGVRRTNLNHRFRHGFAMWLVRDAKRNGHPLDEYTIMRLMRHRTPASTEAYHRPTDEDVKRLVEEIIVPVQERLHADE